MKRFNVAQAVADLAWAAVARIATVPAVTGWLIRRAQRTPYENITGPDGSLYMERWWLFNPLRNGPGGEVLPARWQWLPSVRVQHIVRPDSEKHLHDHPWNARTIVLGGWYLEERPWLSLTTHEAAQARHTVRVFGADRGVFRRGTGYTGRLLFGRYHRISTVPPGGAWTLFFTWRKRGTWGFEVHGRKMPWREYLAVAKAWREGQS